MRATLRSISCCLLASLVLPARLEAAPDMRGHEPMASRASRESDVRDAMRKLWVDHVTWTRLYIISDAPDIADKHATTQRLLRNQDAIGNAIRPFSGDAAAERLAALLREHFLGTADRLAEAKAGDKVGAAEADRKWRVN